MALASKFFENRRLQIRNHFEMAMVQELRRNPGVIRDMPNARMALSIPPLEFEKLKLKYPVLVNGSTAERKAFMNKFIRSSESKPYRVK